MATIDYDRPATISWATRPYRDDPRSVPLEEHCGDLTLRDAVIFAIDHLDAGCRESIIIKCGAEKYNSLDIQAIYQRLNFQQVSVN
jgi:hypothetical protein